MNQLVHKFVQIIEDNKGINAKERMIEIVGNSFDLVKDGRAIYHTDFFAVVFCYSKNSSFPNVVLSLSKLEKYDNIPCFVVVVKKDRDNAIYIINTTFIDKISHSGRGTRGTAQFNGKTINEILNDQDFHNNINENQSKAFLRKLLDR